MLKSLLVVAAFGMLQMSSKEEKKPQVVPITQEEHHHLVLENDYVRVFHVEVAPHAETKYHQHDMDYVFVTLGDSVVENDRIGEKPATLELKDGQAIFVKGGFAHKAVNLSDKPFVNVTVELKNTGDSTPVSGFVGAGFSSTENVMVSRKTRCEVISTNSGASGTGIPESRERLVIAISGFFLNDEPSPTKPGEAKWSTKDLRLKAPPAVDQEKPWLRPKIKAAVCEFAREGEDFLRK